MAVSICFAQFTTQAGAISPTAAKGTPTPSSAAPAAEEATSQRRGASAASPAPELSTDMRVDDQRHVYYEFVNKRTGDVVCEIPPEVIRELGENLDALPAAPAQGLTLDVKS